MGFRRWFLIYSLFVVAALGSLESTAAVKTGKKKKQAKPKADSVMQTLDPTQSGADVGEPPPSSGTGTAKGAGEPAALDTSSGDTRHYVHRFNSGIGVNLVSGLGSAFQVGAQYGYAIWEGQPFYFGPDIGFSLFSPGSFLSGAIAAWYEMRIYGAPNLGMSVGAGLGPVIMTSPIAQYGSVTYQAFLEACIVQHINSLASVRGQFRPSMVGGYFGFSLNLNVQFRFQ